MEAIHEFLILQERLHMERLVVEGPLLLQMIKVIPPSGEEALVEVSQLAVVRQHAQVAVQLAEEEAEALGAR
jgi:hypothetical protein